MRNCVDTHVVALWAAVAMSSGDAANCETVIGIDPVRELIFPVVSTFGASRAWLSKVIP